MGYKDEFYKEDNIIGYTGHLLRDPTVYFFESGIMYLTTGMPKTINIHGKDQILLMFGHITQKYSNSDYLRRERVRKSYSYSICNIFINKIKTAQECVYGVEELDKLNLGRIDVGEGHMLLHKSRSEFIPINENNKKLLVPAIDKYLNLKKCIRITASLSMWCHG